METKSRSQMKQILSWFLFYPGIIILLIQMAIPEQDKLTILIGCFLSFIGIVVRDDLTNKAVYKNVEEKFKVYFLVGAFALLAISIGFLTFILFNLSSVEISAYSKLIATLSGIIVLYFLLPLEFCLFKHYMNDT